RIFPVAAFGRRLVERDFYFSGRYERDSRPFERDPAARQHRGGGRLFFAPRVTPDALDLPGSWRNADCRLASDDGILRRFPSDRGRPDSIALLAAPIACAGAFVPDDC